MFRLVSIAVFAVLLIWTVLYLRSRSKNSNRAIVTDFLRSAFRRQGLRSLAGIRNNAYALTWILFALLTISGFLSVAIFGAHLSGILLLIHVTAAPFFAIMLAALIVLSAHKHRFLQSDWSALRDMFRKKNNPETDMVDSTPGPDRSEIPNSKFQKTTIQKKGLASPDTNTVQKICFWVIAILSLPLILSIILSMSDLFSAENQASFLNTHSYSALLILIVFVAHTVTLLSGISAKNRKGEEMPETAGEQVE